jgi:hypothetical protein
MNILEHILIELISDSFKADLTQLSQQLIYHVFIDEPHVLGIGVELVYQLNNNTLVLVIDI